MIKTVLLLACTFLPSPLRIAIWRLLGFKIGPHCRIAMFSIVVADTIEMGTGCLIEPLSFIYRPRRFFMGERARINGFVRILGYGGEVSLGPQSMVTLGCLIDCSSGIELGDRSQIGPRSMLYSHGATGLIYNMRYPHKAGTIRIGQDVWIGMGCVIHPQVSIGNAVIILPHMVIRHSIPGNKVVLPIKHEHVLVDIRYLQNVTDETRQQTMEKLFYQYADSIHAQVTVQRAGEILVASSNNGASVYLLRPGIEPTDLTIAPANSAIWTMACERPRPGVPTFCFSKLVVYGPHTALAERLAQFACRPGGAHFVFQDDGKSPEH